MLTRSDSTNTNYISIGSSNASPSIIYRYPEYCVYTTRVMYFYKQLRLCIYLTYQKHYSCMCSLFIFIILFNLNDENPRIESIVRAGSLSS